jgi:hypothetical protein
MMETLTRMILQGVDAIANDERNEAYGSHWHMLDASCLQCLPDGDFVGVFVSPGVVVGARWPDRNICSQCDTYAIINLDVCLCFTYDPRSC